MKAQGAQQVYEEVAAHIRKQGYASSDWYCGIASNWQDSLFDDHQVPRKGRAYIACRCFTDEDAREAARALVKIGCDGEPGGGDQTTVYVYAYHKGTMTKP